MRGTAVSQQIERMASLLRDVRRSGGNEKGWPARISLEVMRGPAPHYSDTSCVTIRGWFQEEDAYPASLSLSTVV